MNVEHTKVEATDVIRLYSFAVLESRPRTTKGPTNDDVDSGVDEALCMYRQPEWPIQFSGSAAQKRVYSGARGQKGTFAIRDKTSYHQH